MEVRVGVQHVARELVVETDLSADAVAEAVAKTTQGEALDLVDDKGRRVVVPAASLAYVEIGQETRHRVGFGA